MSISHSDELIYINLGIKLKVNYYRMQQTTCIFRGKY